MTPADRAEIARLKRCLDTAHRSWLSARLDGTPQQIEVATLAYIEGCTALALALQGAS